MSDNEITKSFDKKIASIWAVIALGAFKSIETTIGLVADHLITVEITGLDVTMVALYLSVCTIGTTALVFWNATAGKVIEEATEED